MKGPVEELKSLQDSPYGPSLGIFTAEMPSCEGRGLGDQTSIPERDKEFSSKQHKDRLWPIRPPIQWAPGVFLRL